MFNDQTLLITGGTGSFGGAVLKKLLSTKIKNIRIFSRDEKKQDDMRHFFRNSKIKYYIGDVRNIDSLDEAMSGVDYVFHAAALKQVPSCEFYPMEAIQTNAIGTDNVLKTSINHKIKKVVVLSTDKAAYPINAMGMTKALMEKIMIARSRVAAEKGLIQCGTRYGNVMASRGSVIPLFIKQIESNNDITVTDLQMTRFMMTLDDAVDLVFYAFEHGKPGDLFVQKAPAVTIGTLAMAIQKILNAKNRIKEIGIRHGEKIFETLLTKEEKAKAIDLGNYYRVPADNRDLNYNLFFSEGMQKYSDVDDYNSHNTKRLDIEEMTQLLFKITDVKEAMSRRGITV